MSIAEPSREVRAACDSAALWEVERKVKELAATGKLDAVAFDALWTEGLAATGGHAELLESVAMFRL